MGELEGRGVRRENKKSQICFTLYFMSAHSVKTTLISNLKPGRAIEMVAITSRAIFKAVFPYLTSRDTGEPLGWTCCQDRRDREGPAGHTFKVSLFLVLYISVGTQCYKTGNTPVCWSEEQIIFFHG